MKCICLLKRKCIFHVPRFLNAYNVIFSVLLYKYNSGFNIYDSRQPTWKKLFIKSKLPSFVSNFEKKTYVTEEYSKIVDKKKLYVL